MTRVGTFEHKLPGMRKPDSFIVYPKQEDGSYVVQGSRSIVWMLPSKGAIANIKGNNTKYFIHLRPEMGATSIDLPQAFINLVKEHLPDSGDLIGSSPETGPVYLA